MLSLGVGAYKGTPCYDESRPSWLPEWLPTASEVSCSARLAAEMAWDQNVGWIAGPIGRGVTLVGEGLDYEKGILTGDVKYPNNKGEDNPKPNDSFNGILIIGGVLITVFLLGRK